MKADGKHVQWLLFVVLGLAAVARIPGLEQIPPPLNQDEASRGYDAWCLWETGADRHGRSWPMFLESFGPGDFSGALTTYLTVPFVAWLGPRAVAMRLPDAVLGVSTVWLLFLWLRRQAGAPTALFAAAVLALDPWHIALSRTAHEAGFSPFFLVAALTTASFAGLLPNRPSPDPTASRDTAHHAVWAFVAGFMFALSAWVYPASRLFTPLFCLAIAGIYLRTYQRGWTAGPMRVALAAAVAGLILGGAPLWVTALRDPAQLASRAQTTLLVYGYLTWPEVIRQAGMNYLAAFDPRYWFVQSDEMSGASIPNVGLHLVVFAPLWAIGLIRVIGRQRRCTFSRLLLMWLLLHPVPAAICGDWNPHPMRSSAGIALFPILTALGGDSLWRRLASRPAAIRRTAAIPALLAVAANVLYFTDAYYRRFPAIAEGGYQGGLVRAFRFVAAHKDEADVVLVTNRANQPYIYALLFEPIPPEALRLAPPVVCDGPKGFHQVLAAGRYLFVPPDPKNYPEAARRFRALLQAVPPSSRRWVIEVDRSGGAESVRARPLFRWPSDSVTHSGWPGYVVRPWRLAEGPPPGSERPTGAERPPN